jgi:hypothetical protein
VPARLREIIRAFAAFGGAVEPSRGGSSHWIASKDGRVFPLTAHNGPKSEISDLYIRGMCRCFGLDEEEFRKFL